MHMFISSVQVVKKKKWKMTEWEMEIKLEENR